MVIAWVGSDKQAVSQYMGVSHVGHREWGVLIAGCDLFTSSGKVPYPDVYNWDRGAQTGCGGNQILPLYPGFSPMLVAFIYLYQVSGGSFRYSIITGPIASRAANDIYRLLLAFAVKVPMPVHTWLPDAHVEAPTGGSVVLQQYSEARRLWFLRFSLPIVPDASHHLRFMIVLALVAVVYIDLSRLSRR